MRINVGLTEVCQGEIGIKNICEDIMAENVLNLVEIIKSQIQ